MAVAGADFTIQSARVSLAVAAAVKEEETTLLAPHRHRAILAVVRVMVPAEVLAPMSVAVLAAAVQVKQDLLAELILAVLAVMGMYRASPAVRLTTRLAVVAALIIQAKTAALAVVQAV